MIKVYILTSEIDIEAEKAAELTGKDYKPEQSYTESYINPSYIMRVIPQDIEDCYLLAFPSEDIIAKIAKSEYAKILEG